MKKYINPDRSLWESLVKRSSASYASLEPLAKVIFDKVEKDGDGAIKNYTLEFDNVELESSIVTFDEISSAVRRVPEELKSAIQKAKKILKYFTVHKLPQLLEWKPSQELIVGKRNCQLKKWACIFLVALPRYFLQF